MYYRTTVILVLLACFVLTSKAAGILPNSMAKSKETSSATLVTLSEELLLAVRYTEPTDSLLQHLPD